MSVFAQISGKKLEKWLVLVVSDQFIIVIPAHAGISSFPPLTVPFAGEGGTAERGGVVAVHTHHRRCRCNYPPARCAVPLLDKKGNAAEIRAKTDTLKVPCASHFFDFFLFLIFPRFLRL